MKNRFLLYTALVLAVAASFSCKKDDEKTETKPSIYGVDFDLPTFARPGETFVLTPRGAYTIEGDGVKKYTYKWKIGTDSYQEMDTFTLKLEEVGNYTIFCQASDPDEKYYSSVASKVIIVIDPTLEIGRGDRTDPGSIPFSVLLRLLPLHWQGRANPKS